jgi:hypothetical protein
MAPCATSSQATPSRQANLGSLAMPLPSKRLHLTPLRVDEIGRILTADLSYNAFALSHRRR